MVKVKAPNKNYNAQALGVEWVNGVAEVEDVAHAKYIAEYFGYELVEEKPKPAKKPTKAEQEKAKKDAEAESK